MDALLLFRASLLLSATLLVAHLLRRAPAASRHRLWTLAFAAILALPLLGVVVPAIYLPMPVGRLTSRPYTVGSLAVTTGTLPPGDETAAARGKAAPFVLGDSRASSTTHRESRPGFTRPSVRAFLVTAWVAGSVAAAAVLLVSLIRVRRLARTADDMDDASWTTSASALGIRLGLRRPARLFVSPAVGTPMAGGVWRPAIFLPSSARGWSAEQRDVVLAHELAHLAGHDPLRHVAARLAVAFYWFHPLAWMAARQAVAAREQACDEAVLALGTRPSAYARVLLDLAAAQILTRPAPARLGALPMVERSHLEARLMAILNEGSLPRRSSGGAEGGVAARRGVVIPAVGVALCTLAVAAAQPGVRASAAQVTPAAAAVQPAPEPLVAVRPKPGQLPAVWLNAAPSQPAADSACAAGRSRWSSFMGRTDTRVIDGRTVILEQVGTNGSDRIIQDSFGDLRVCMVVERAGPTVTGEKPSLWVGRAERMVLEARRGDRTERLEIGPYGTGQRVSWQVDGKDRGFDAAAQQWRDRMLAALDTIWEVSMLRGEVSTLHGEISTIRGEESTLRGEISTLHGEISTMRGRQSTIRGEESTLRGEISTIRGQVSSLQGAISSERGSISSLTAGGYRSDDPARMKDLLNRHLNEIVRLEREIRDYNADAKVAAVEREIARLDADKKVDAIETEIRNFNLSGKVTAIDRQIAALDVNGKIARLERAIAALNLDARERELEKRRDDELKRLEAAIAAIR